MRDKTIEMDDFTREIEDILSEVQSIGGEAVVNGVKRGVREGAKLWRQHAKDRIGTHEYRRHGETITSGKYAKSIRSHMISTSELRPSGEVGSAKLSGLTHLLEKGHARIGGGRVQPKLKLSKEVAPQTFQATIDAILDEMDEGFRGF